MEGLNSKNKNIKGGCTYSFKSSQIGRAHV